MLLLRVGRCLLNDDVLTALGNLLCVSEFEVVFPLKNCCSQELLISTPLWSPLFPAALIHTYTPVHSLKWSSSLHHMSVTYLCKPQKLATKLAG